MQDLNEKNFKVKFNILLRLPTSEEKLGQTSQIFNVS